MPSEMQTNPGGSPALGFRSALDLTLDEREVLETFAIALA